MNKQERETLLGDMLVAYTNISDTISVAGMEAALAVAEAEIRADALESAARDYPAATEDMDLVNYAKSDPADWLTDRAAAIRARSQAATEVVDG